MYLLPTITFLTLHSFNDMHFKEFTVDIKANINTF